MQVSQYAEGSGGGSKPLESAGQKRTSKVKRDDEGQGTAAGFKPSPANAG